MGCLRTVKRMLTVSKAEQGIVSGSIELTPVQVRPSLRDHQLYIQISSEKAPDGRLWGWLVS